MYKKAVFFFMTFMLFLKTAHSMVKVDQIDGLNLNFKIYLDSYVKSKKSNNVIDFKKSKLGFLYNLDDQLDFVATFLYTKNNEFEFDQEFFNYYINNHSFISLGNIRTIFDMYFEKSEEHLSIVIPVINKATGFFVKTKGLGFIYKNNFSDNLSFHVSAVGKNINDSSDDSGVLTLRTFYFKENGDNIIHLGLNNSFIYNDKKKREDKEINNIYYGFGIKKLNSTGFEFASRLKNFTLESGIFYVKMNPFIEELKGKYFNSYNFYSEFNYVLTGEVKNYEKINGVIKKLKVKNPVDKGGIGTFETVARYQFTNAITNRSNYSLDMGRHKILLLGFNWLPTDYCKVLLNYSNIKSYYKVKGNVNNDEFKIEYRFFL